MLRHLGLVASSKALFFRFLNAAVHPAAVADDLQAKRVEQINEHLRYDGYRLQHTGRLSGSGVFTVEAAAIGLPADATISDALARARTATGSCTMGSGSRPKDERSCRCDHSDADAGGGCLPVAAA